MPRKLCLWSWITFSIIFEIKGSKDKGRQLLGAVFEPFLNSDFYFAISQSNGNMEYFIDKLKIWETGLPKTVTLFFKNLPDRSSRPAALFSSRSWRSFNTVSLDTKLNVNLQLGYFRDFS